jgi:GNAT superfamily N-acetyltransferase
LSASVPGKTHVEKLALSHVLAEFDCSSAPLNRFLQSFALINQSAGSSATYVAIIGTAVAGYHSLTVGQANFDDAPERLAKGLPRHPIPVMIIARLAVDRRFQGQGLGSALLRDAFLRTLAAAEIAGIRGVIVHAKDERASAFYEHFGFTPFGEKSLTLYRLLKDIKARPI